MGERWGQLPKARPGHVGGIGAHESTDCGEPVAFSNRPGAQDTLSTWSAAFPWGPECIVLWLGAQKQHTRIPVPCSPGGFHFPPRPTPTLHAVLWSLWTPFKYSLTPAPGEFPQR